MHYFFSVSIKSENAKFSHLPEHEMSELLTTKSYKLDAYINLKFALKKGY